LRVCLRVCCAAPDYAPPSAAPPLVIGAEAIATAKGCEANLFMPSQGKILVGKHRPQARSCVGSA